ncbi:MAG: hypothetical protein Q4F57_07830 [Weeksellaceae bacterium]|nr:hypothetical protein [Weeksellaceae bacterium]
MPQYSPDASGYPCETGVGAATRFLSTGSRLIRESVLKRAVAAHTREQDNSGQPGKTPKK